MSDASTLTSIGVGICTGHLIPIPTAGVIITSSGDTKIDNLGSARVTDIILSFCGHVGVLVTGAGTVKTNSLSKVRIGSVFVGVFSGVIITGFSGVQIP